VSAGEAGLPIVHSERCENDEPPTFEELRRVDAALRIVLARW
jgi:hypothetical protein